MAKNFKVLLNKMSPERRARIKDGASRLREEMALNELREARRLTQGQLAEQLGVGQAEVSRIERRTDIYVSTLARMVEAMGGRLEMRAIFDDGIVPISRFGAV